HRKRREPKRASKESRATELPRGKGQRAKPRTARKPSPRKSEELKRERPSPPKEQIQPGASVAFPVVGIGASAGGLEAFSQLLHELAPPTGMAIVLVQHLAPRHDSFLTDLLARQTALPIVQVSDGMPLAPDCVYVIPPNVQ